MEKNAPRGLTHTPIVAVDYEKIDEEAGAGDAKFLSIGYSTWTKDKIGKDYSVKIFRKDDKNKWSRQSEEMPLWRVLDIATLLLSIINDKKSYLEEFVQDSNSIDALKEYLQENMAIYGQKVAELKKVLETSTVSDDNGQTPNIFDFATSELSQDAIFAWLIQWADNKYKVLDAEIHYIAIDFLRLLLGNNTFEINSVEVGRQWNNIDVWVKINADSFLIIEDKTETSIHDNQLERYKTIVEEEFKGKRSKLFFAYVKTGNEPLNVLKNIENKGYHTVSRSDIIQCINTYKGKNSLLLNYSQHLIGIEKDTQSFKELPVSKWGWYAWQGFYKALETKLEINSWSYVANKAGGFLGAWWHFTPIEEGEMYLQFEEKKLCFKVCYEGKRDRSEVRREHFNRLMSLARQQNRTEIQKPARFGAGHYMTIAIVDPDYLFGNEKVNMEDLVSKLKSYQSLIDICCKC